MSTPNPLPFVSVSFGSSLEPTAVAVVERSYKATGEPETRRRRQGGQVVITAVTPVANVYRCRHLKRFSPPYRYKTVYKHITEIIGSVGESILVADITRVGRPLLRSLREKIVTTLDPVPTLTIIPLTISWSAGGATVSRALGHSIPRRDLVSSALDLFEGGQLQIAEGMSLTPTLVTEFAEFRPSKNPADDLTGWRLNKNDDLVLSVAQACWSSEAFVRREIHMPVGIEQVDPLTNRTRIAEG